MQFWNTNMFAGVAILVCLASVYAQGQEKPAVAILGKSHTFKCNLSPGENGILWLDNVYNMEANKPAIIFQSSDNPERDVNSDHHISSRLSVDESFSLTISALEGDDAGIYFCQTTESDGTVIQEKYFLTLGSAPSCEGETEDRRPGDQVTLSCSMTFSGSETPVLEWFAGPNMIDSNDDYTIMLAKKTVDLEVVPSMNGVEYKCRATFGDVIEECSFNMEVFYSIQELVIEPEEEVAVGQEVVCRAMGNPEPDITLTKPDQTQMTGKSEVRFQVPEEMRGTDIDVSCKGQNTVDDNSNMQQTSTILTVIDETPREEPEPETDEVTDGDHNNPDPEGSQITDEEAEPSGGGNGGSGTGESQLIVHTISLGLLVYGVLVWMRNV